MAWKRMRFKDQIVWVRADDSGRPLLDSTGRAEMKYRENDEKTYRPSLSNLSPEGGGDMPAAAPAAPRRASSGARPSSARAAAHHHRPHAPLKVAGALEVWTDGACSGNPGPMGIGVVVVDGDQRQEISEYLGVGTNNIAELVAIERGLEAATKLMKTGARRVRVYSDSGYAIGLLEKGWKAKANQELVARLRTQVATVENLEFVKVAGHAGVPENERCDELARQAILNRR